LGAYLRPLGNPGPRSIAPSLADYRHLGPAAAGTDSDAAGATITPTAQIARICIFRYLFYN
jgi:hypothetical protein